MTNRNDLEVAHSRIESLEREKRALADQNALLNARLQPQPKRVEPMRLTPPPMVASPVVASPVETDADEESWAPWATTLLVAVLAIATAAIIMTTGQT
jgi:hypothetical protein